MTTDDIVLAAYNGTLPNGVMRLPERLLYQTVKCISQAYKTAQIDAQAASRLKADAISDYRADKTHYETLLDSVRRQAALWKDIELATTAYRLERKKVEELTNEIVLIPTEVQNVDKLIQLYRTLENADKVIETLYGLR